MSKEEKGATIGARVDARKWNYFPETHFEFVDHALNFHAAGAPNLCKIHAGYRFDLDVDHRDRNGFGVCLADRSESLCPRRMIHQNMRDAPRAQIF